MKNLIIIIVLFISNLSYSQFLPMLEEDHTWSVDINGSLFGEDPWRITENISVSGSTIINDKTYKTVTNDHISEINCLVREENGIVFRYDETINDEFVMYDFTLEVGDTFTFFQQEMYCSIYGYIPSAAITVEVINTSIQFIAGENRKVIEFGDFFQDEETWIEGIGSIRGFDYIGIVWDIIDFTELVCFTNNVDTYFFNGASSCDNTTLEIEDVSVNSIVLYPNPVTNQSILNLPLETLVNHITIVDINGRIIKDEIINKDYYIINNMDFPSGLYFYSVFNKTELIKTNKFIIN